LSAPLTRVMPRAQISSAAKRRVKAWKIPNMKNPRARNELPKQSDILLPQRSATIPVGTSKAIMAAEKAISRMNIRR